MKSWLQTHLALVIIAGILVIAAVVVVIVASLGSGGVDKKTDEQQTPLLKDQQLSSFEQIEQLPGEPIRVTGVLVCLRLKDGSAAPDSGCPTGLQADDGKAYSLIQDPESGPPLLRNKPFGQPVEVIGSLRDVTRDYKIDGTIILESIEVN